MKKIIVGLASLGLMAGGVVGASPATAAPGTFSGPSATISWDDTNWYVPTYCSRYPVQYTTTMKNLTSQVELIGPNQEKLAMHGIYGRENSGSADILLCENKLQGFTGDIPLTLRFTDGQDFVYGDGSKTVFEAQVVLHSLTPAAAPAAKPMPKSVKCISKKTFKKKTFKGRTKCPTGWVKI